MEEQQVSNQVPYVPHPATADKNAQMASQAIQENTQLKAALMNERTAHQQNMRQIGNQYEADVQAAHDVGIQKGMMAGQQQDMQEQPGIAEQVIQAAQQGIPITPDDARMAAEELLASGMSSEEVDQLMQQIPIKQPQQASTDNKYSM